MYDLQTNRIIIPGDIHHSVMAFIRQVSPPSCALRNPQTTAQESLLFQFLDILLAREYSSNRVCDP